MSNISQKLTYLNETKSQLKDMINYGLPTEEQITSSTTFRNYVSSIFNAFLEALRNPDTLFTNLPKKSGTGANITLNDTANAPMRIELGASELSQDGTPTPSSPQDIHTISGNNKVVVCGKNIIDIPDGSYTMTNYWYKDFATNKLITSDMVGKKISFSYDIDIESVSTTSTEISGVIGRGTTPNGMSSQISSATYSPTTGEQHIKIENITIQETWVGQYLVVRFAGFNVRSDCTYNYSNVQIEYGETASNFEPYISQEAEVDLDTLEYCKIGNYEDKFIRSNDGTWQLEKNIGKVVLDGSDDEGWTFYNTNTNRTCAYIRLNNVESYISAGDIPNLFSNYFKRTTQGATWKEGDISRRTQDTGIIFFCFTPSYTTIDDIKAWLTTHNTELYYVLATPTYIQITGTLETQLENIYQKLLSYTGTTNISQINNDLGFVMSVSAIEEL